MATGHYTPGDDVSVTDRVGGGFMTGFVVAQIGAYVSFLPLLQILVPLKVAALDPAHKAELLSQIASLGALAAGLSNLAVGWASDRTRSRWGRRPPWIVGGALATALSYVLIGSARTPGELLASVLIFQLAFNVVFAPLLALIPDRVPDRQKGWVSALTGLGLPLGTIIGSVLVGAMLQSEAARFGALALIVMVTMVPFALTLRDVPLAAPEPPKRFALSWPRFTRDFTVVWIGRYLVLMAFSLVQTYLLFYLQSTLRYGVGRHGGPAADMARLAVVFGVANVVTGLAVGWASDRIKRRKLFVISGALVVGASMAGLAFARSWQEMLASYAVLGCGAGCYYAIDLALISQVLPSTRSVGRDLGVVNLSNTAPAIFAPLVAGLLLTAPGAEIRWLFVLAAGLAALGAVMIVLVRGVK